MSWIDDHDIDEVFEESPKNQECSHNWELDDPNIYDLCQRYVCTKCGKIEFHY